MVVLIALLGTGHSYFKTYRTTTPVEAVLIEPVETTSIEFLIELVELERPVVVPIQLCVTLAHDEVECGTRPHSPSPGLRDELERTCNKEGRTGG